METFRRVMDVNFFGMVAVTKKVLPLIRKAKGRVVNIASVLGRVSLRGTDAYTSSKHAVEGFSDSIRLSMKPWKCKVVIIEPGVMNTPLLKPPPEVLAKAIAETPEDVRRDYGDDYMKVNTSRNLEIAIKLAQDPNFVVNALVTAVSAVHPKSRYQVGWDAKLIFIPASIMPAVISDFVLGATVRWKRAATAE